MQKRHPEYSIKMKQFLNILENFYTNFDMISLFEIKHRPSLVATVVLENFFKNL
jgi:hypothetical protein